VPPASSSAHVYGGRRVVVDHTELRRQGLLAPEGQERQLGDEYSLIKRPILANASSMQEPPVREGNLLMVASATSGEGKTFTCINLCLSIAREQDWSVVLVDGDCSKPHVTRLFGAEQEPGLMDLLQGPEKSFDSAVMATDIPRLSILPAGRARPDAAELLASERMRKLCASISAADSRRMIVFDSAPLLLTAEASVLASQVGQVVVVVHANKTPQAAVLEALARLDHTKAVNLLLNQAGPRSAAAQYGDYYGSSAA
jgi:exopolysaccharide/PEP-CTERM locus tyrosine autokinase